ncbi:MAG: LPS translocon maturation chaperone LptM [Rubrivivax sp.]
MASRARSAAFASRRVAVVALTLFGLAACGQKGPLTLPAVPAAQGAPARSSAPVRTAPSAPTPSAPASTPTR